MFITNVIVTDGYDGVPLLGLLRVNWGRYKLFAAPADLIDDDWFLKPYWNVFEMHPGLRKHEIQSARRFRRMVGWEWNYWNEAELKSKFQGKMPTSKSTKVDWMKEKAEEQSEYEDIWRHIPHCKIIGFTDDLLELKSITKPYLIARNGIRIDKGLQNV